MNTNVENIVTVVRRLGPLADRVVFLGGATTEFLITDSAAPVPRATLDVDVVITVANRSEFARLEQELRDRGFRNFPGGPICRWAIDGVLVDVMPTDPAILGFASRWSQASLHNAQNHEVAPGIMIRLITAPYFLATKLEAFAGRGEGDYLSSADIEDIVAVVDGRPTIVDEVAAASPDVATFVAETLAGHLANPRFRESVGGHLPGDPASQARAGRVLERIEAIAARIHS